MKTEQENYETLSKEKRLAIFLTVIGPEAAAAILRTFDDMEIQSISKEMLALDLIDADLQKKVIDEFSSLLLSGSSSILGGYEPTLRALEIARGPYHARNLVGKMEPTRDSRDIIQEISEMEARQISNLIKSEQPQTIAFLLGSMNPAKAAEIVALLDKNIRSEVIMRMGTLEATPSAVLDKIVTNLAKHIDNRGQQTMSHFGGAGRVAKVLNQLDKQLSKFLLSDIEDSNPELGAQIRQKMFSFNDLIRLSQADIQRILREVDSATIVMAIKPAPEPLKDLIFGCLSKRAAEALREELSMLGSVRFKEVEAAQESIIQAVRKLEEDGEISLSGDGANQYV